VTIGAGTLSAGAISLRKWQAEALEVYDKAKQAERKSILWEATPGSGKTFAALQLCKIELAKRSAKRVIVVVPTTHLKLQWERAAMEVGFALDSNFHEKKKTLARDYHGAVLSYQQIGCNPKKYKALASNAVVVLDEVHHAGDGLSWGESLKFCFSTASFVLCLSGTAFRSDNNPIPFVHYSPEGVSEPDYSYTYSDAVGDRVCRPTAFFTYGGDVAWQDGEAQVSANFSDAIDKVGRAKRLRAALDPESGWIEPMLKDADQMLTAVRKEHPQAGALLVASSQKNARALAKVIFKVSGRKAVVVLSEDPVANKKLKAFEAGNDRWLVACNMVSEGVDVPRLRIGVFATTVKTKMYFRQFLGRIVRKTNTPEGVQTAFFYLPADHWLKRLAEEVEEEQRHNIVAATEDGLLDFLVERDEKDLGKEDTWRALKSTNSGLESVISGGGQLTLWGGLSEDAAQIPDLAIPKAEPRTLTKTEMKEEIAKEIRSLVSSYHSQSGQPYSHIHGLLNKRQGLKSQNDCTENQLRERLSILQKIVNKA